MRFFEIVPACVVESFSSIGVDELGISDVVKKADDTLTGIAADAIDRFVGVTPGAKERSEWGGVMLSRWLEDAYSSDPSQKGLEIRKQLDAAFAPVKAALKSRFGNHIVLYRGQGEVGKDLPNRSTLSWTSDPKIAAWFAGVDPRLMKLEPITDAEIASFLKKYHDTGKASFLGKTYVRSDQPTNDPDLDDFYYDIYDRTGDHITDGDDIESQLRKEQEYRQSLIDDRDDKFKKVIKAKIPIDDIIWITDRAGQSEFILHNRPGAPGYIDATGRLIKG